MDWLWDNKEWVFSGAGLVVLGWIVKALFFRVNSGSNIKSGDNSINIQGSHDVRVESGVPKNDK